MLPANVGLSINFQKSSLREFSDDPQTIQVWADILGCKVTLGPFCYLGATIGTSPRLTTFWNPLINNIKSKLEGWEVKHLSMLGRLVLLKAVIDIIPIFWFNLYLIPVTVLKHIERLRRGFIWGQTTQGKPRLHLLKWDKLIMQKKEG